MSDDPNKEEEVKPTLDEDVYTAPDTGDARMTHAPVPPTEEELQQPPTEEEAAGEPEAVEDEQRDPIIEESHRDPEPEA